MSNRSLSTPMSVYSHLALWDRPALLTNMETLPKWAITLLKAGRWDFISHMSSGRTKMSDSWSSMYRPTSMHLALTSSRAAPLLAEITTFAPYLTASMARAAPIPLLAPVIQMTCPDNFLAILPPNLS